MVIALPLSKLTVGLLGSAELAAMKSDAILVNVARAEIVDEEALYRRLVSYPQFTYATDVWQSKRGKETYSSKFPLVKLPNFIGTPHVAGGSSALTGEPSKDADGEPDALPEGRGAPERRRPVRVHIELT